MARVPKDYISTLQVMALLLLTTSALTSDLPTVFDLRDHNGINYVTSVKSQSGGTCWTFGAMAAMESNLLMTGVWIDAGETGEPDLAEYHLDWWNGFNQFNNDDTDPPTGGGLEVHQGGDYLVSAAYLSRGEGAVRDEDGQSFSNPPDRHLDSYNYYWPLKIEFFTIGEDLENMELLKMRLMEKGVIGTCLSYNSAFISDFIHYQPPYDPQDPNHAVSIIGWNDTLETQAPLPGAWLCKNSWGTGWGMDGYFYISYYDKHSTRNPEMGAVSLTAVESVECDRIYYHDYHGWRETLNDCTEAFNTFTADGPEMLREVSFFTARDSVGYNVRVYGSFADGQLEDMLGETSGTAGMRGLHTIELDNGVYLDSGQEFHIYVELAEGGHPYDCTSDVPVLLGASYRTIVESTASPGESRFRSGDSWLDLTAVDETANFCIKGIAYDRGLDVDRSGTLTFEGSLGGPFNPSSIPVSITCRESSPIPYQISFQPVVSWLDVSGAASGIISPGMSAAVTLTPNLNASSLPDGVYSSVMTITDLSDTTSTIDLQIVLMIGEGSPQYIWDLDADPGWSTEGGWEYGVPLGQGG